MTCTDTETTMSREDLRIWALERAIEAGATEHDVLVLATRYLMFTAGTEAMLDEGIKEALDDLKIYLAKCRQEGEQDPENCGPSKGKHLTMADCDPGPEEPSPVPRERDYIGTKRITAWPERRGQFDGYGVRYPDGYRSWSPAEAFEAAYQPVTAMDFEGAMHALKAGEWVARAGWNGKGMKLFLATAVPGFSPFIAINTGAEVRPWLASQADMLATDWTVLP